MHALTHLLAMRGYDYHSRAPSSELPVVKHQNGDEELLDTIDMAVRFCGGGPVGFVLDADYETEHRWQAVCERLARVAVCAPNRIPEEGFVGKSAPYGARVGVWLMPDNRRPGKLETFLRDLLHEGDSILEHAEEATRVASDRGAGFRDVDREKAVLYAWLAWQRTPGLPFGTAIRAKYFDADANAAEGFVRWFSTVFESG